MYLRESIAVFWTFVFPFVWILGAGVFMPEDVKKMMVYVLVPGLCTLVMVTTGVLGTIFTLIYYREARIYETINLMGMAPLEIVAAQILSRALISVINAVGLLVTGVLLFKAMTWLQLLFALPQIVGVVILGVLLFFNLSILLSMLFKSPPTGYWVAMMLATVLIVLGGCFYDAALLPPAMSRFSYYVPSYHLNELLRSVIGAGRNTGEHMCVLLLMVIVLCMINCNFYDVRHKHRQ